LDLAESCQGVLPPWWNGAKRKQCERIAVDPNCWSNIKQEVEKGDIIEHYGDNLMPMTLRKLGETIYRVGLM
jgi:splicing suppressor protein 51